jgi:hypothetical protein
MKSRPAVPPEDQIEITPEMIRAATGVLLKQELQELDPLYAECLAIKILEAVLKHSGDQNPSDRFLSKLG